MDVKTILGAIGSEEETTFSEFCSALGSDCPEKGDREEWGWLFRHISALEVEGAIEVSRVQGRIDSLILTESGVAWLKRLRAQ